jgi:DNA mismatch endonuclease, patch repair protein
MAAIRGKNTKPELAVRRYLHSRGLRFRLHTRGLPGHPDVVLRKWNALIFVNGCFWHGHTGCQRFVLPKTRRDFWDAKITQTRVRDGAKLAQLLGAGWRVATVWECAIEDSPSTFEILEQWIRSESNETEIP